jgi:hypothetical protein
MALRSSESILTFVNLIMADEVDTTAMSSSWLCQSESYID